MASLNQSLMIQQDEEDEDHHLHRHHQIHHQHQQLQLHNMSRLSLCSVQDNDHGSGGTTTDSHMSLLSVENFDADEEFSDQELPPDGSKLGYYSLGRGVLLSSDSDKETGCYSLPATPPRRRRRTNPNPSSKDYASDNELLILAPPGTTRNRTRRKRSVLKQTSPLPLPLPAENSEKLRNANTNKNKRDEVFGTSSAGESDHSSGVMVIARPKGGRRSLCMDLEEVKACNDLGFELEHEHIMPINPGAGSGLEFDTSSGNNSPIANWRISSPGDDPRDVKARLKVWAQAVALASTSRKGLDFYL